MVEQGRLGPVDWATAARALPGQDDCGDDAVAMDTGGAALFGVIDGLGHGTPAAIAARRAVSVLVDNRAEPLDVLMVMCHRALADTRGAAMTLAQIDLGARGEVTWVGVGNVVASLIEAAPGGPVLRASVLQSGGIVGYQLPPTLQTHSLVMRPGDLLIMHTDGIWGDFLDAVDLAKPTAVLAQDILDGYARESDDAMVLAVRHRGTPP